MIDTVKIRSPYLAENVASIIEARCHTKTSFDNETGDTDYEIVSGSPEGSWEVAPHVNVWRTEIVTHREIISSRQSCGPCVASSRDCEPYITVEGSVHKALMGHNVIGGPTDPLSAIRWYVGYIGKLCGVILPAADEWSVLRVDWAEVFDLGSFESVAEYIHGLALARFPRRTVHRYGDETVMFPGTTTSWKAYHKGPEFSKHDLRRCKRTFGAREATMHLHRANGILRLETAMKAKIWKKGDNDYTKVRELSTSMLEKIHDRETLKVVREGKSEMETVRETSKVLHRLKEVYTERNALSLFGTWLQFSSLGEDAMRTQMGRSTFYSHRKQLAEAGVSWSGTDVHIKDHSVIPEGFAPVRLDPRRLTGESDEVQMQLALYRTA